MVHWPAGSLKGLKGLKVRYCDALWKLTPRSPARSYTLFRSRVP
jgi:hypothetical protein